MNWGTLLLILIGWALTLTSSMASLPPSTTLKDAFLAAVEQASGPPTENVRIQRELLAQSEEVKAQAIGALLPTLSSTATYLEQPPSAAENIFPTTQGTVKLTANQPLFRGFREFAMLRQKNNLMSAQYSVLQNAARQLFYDVATAYYNRLAYQHDLANYQLEIMDSRKRLKDLYAFFKIGRSQLTDVLTFESTIASLESQIESTRGQLENAKDTLAYFTGWDRSIQIDDSPISTHVDGIDSYLSRIEHRPDVLAALENVKAYEEGISIARGAHLPSVDLLGDYYFTRPGVLSGVNWDAAVTLTLPLFQGGVVQSQVRQAQSISRQFSATLWQIRRTAELEVRQFHNAVITDQNQLIKLTSLVDASKKHYDTETRYYRNGLVTNLEVLQAMTTYQNSLRLLDHQKEVAKLHFAKLAAATGDIPEINVKAPAAPYR